MTRTRRLCLRDWAAGLPRRRRRSRREIERLREAPEAKAREAEANQDRYLRALAESDNARKRAAREREDYTRYANESLLRELLPVLDNFDRALPAARGEPGGRRRHRRRRADPARALCGARAVRRHPLHSVGQPFDPDAPRGDRPGVAPADRPT